MLDKIRQYLLSLSISGEDKRYSMDFCKKTEYLNSLRDTAIKNTHSVIHTGYGNVNSQICFITNNEIMLDTIKPLLQNIFDNFRINFWDIYCTFINKTDIEFHGKYSYVINEMYAIKPQVIYVFDNNDIEYNSLMTEINSSSIKLTPKIFYIDIKKLGDSSEETRTELWKYFKYIINYRELD